MTYKVLSIDGGGIRGVIPAVLLQEIEAQTEKPIAELFDLIAGTSTGGILAVGLTAPGQNGKPKFTAADMLSLYTDEGGNIFSRSFWKGVFSVGGLADEKYSADNLEKILKTKLGDRTISKTMKPIVVTAYDIEKREPYFFKTSTGKASKSADYRLRDVARATSAAPTYFEPLEVKRTKDYPVKRRSLVDGGVFANTPAMCAYAEARKLAKPGDDILVVSLGTGDSTRPILHEDAKDWGTLEWVKPIIDVMFDGSSDAVDYQLRQLLPAANGAKKYFRFETKLDKALDDMDAAGKGNIENLKQEARDILADQAQDFKDMCAQLAAAVAPAKAKEPKAA